jgi:hypothetical protein
MMRKWVCGLLAAVTLAVPARAEVLRVAGIYPARADEAAFVNRLAVESLGGRDGPALAFAIEDELNDVTVDQRPWFQVVPNGATADAVLRGFASLDVRTSKITRNKKVCVEEDEKGKCVRKEERKIDCRNHEYVLSPDLRLTARDGQPLYSSSHLSERKTVTVCPDDKEPSRSSIARELSGRIAKSLREDLAPDDRVDDVRVLEKRDGLSRDDGERFKEALRLTKSDPAAACRVWEELAQTNPAQIATAFNVALCAEAAGDDAKARALYDRLLSVGSVSEARDRLKAIDDRERGARQLREHNRS